MNVWLIQIGETLPIRPGIRKLRTAYLADELRRRGHRVVWWASAFDHFRKEWVCNEARDVRVGEDLILKLLKGIGYKKNISVSRILDHRLIARKFARDAVAMPKPDLIVAAMPSYDLSYEAVKFSKISRIPIVVDIRDQWPDIFLEKVKYIPKNIMRVLLCSDFRMLAETMRGATAIVSMMDDLLDWGLKYAERGRTWRDMVFYLGYSKENTVSDRESPMRHLLDKLEGKFIVTFIGTFAEYHNPSSLLRCAKRLEGEANIHFILAGDGHLMPEIKKRAASLRNMTLTGWIEQAEINQLLKRSHVGVCTTNQKALFFPNKAFAYLSEGLPVISAFEGDLKRIIEERKIGFFYPPLDVGELSNCVLKLYRDDSVYHEMAINASEVFKEMFEANKIYENYVDHIERVYQDFVKQ